MQLKSEFLELFSQLGTSKMSSAAYDTAWVAETIALGEPMGEYALEWLRENQLPNGSWGVSDILYNHDRVINTLAAMITLTRWGNEKDRQRVKRARLGLDTAMRSLHTDVAGATAGFEMIIPLLLETAYELGATQRKEDRAFSYASSAAQRFARRKTDQEEIPNNTISFDQMKEFKKKKLASLPDGIINKHVTISFSAEMVGSEGVHLLDTDNLLEIDGSVAGNPAATAFYALHVNPGNETALTYLRNVAQKNNLFDGGGIPEVAPFDTYEISWVLWNLSLLDNPDDFKAQCEPYLDFLAKDWKTGKGVSFAKDYSLMDSDNTSIVFEVLHKFGRPVDLETLLSYEEEEHFRCYNLESNPSVGVNIHILGALREAGLDIQHPSVQKIIKFLKSNTISDTFWADKWHTSPYYATAHAIIVASGFVDDLVFNAVPWIIETQKDDGSWGYYISTAEETAYCLQALFIWRQHGGQVSTDVLKKGIDWLSEHSEPPYPPLWISKCLNIPELIVRSAILSALSLGSDI